LGILTMQGISAFIFVSRPRWFPFKETKSILIHCA
jgi:hypothetical protein